MPNPTTCEDAAPSPHSIRVVTPVLAYSGAITFTVSATDETLTITAPAPVTQGRIARQISFFIAGLFLTTIIGVASVRALADGNPLAVFCVLVFVFLLPAGAVYILRSVAHMARDGQCPAYVHVWRGGIEVTAMDGSTTVRCALPRDQIRDVRASRAAGPYRRTLMLEITSTDGTWYLAPIPWPSDESIADAEDRMREILRLAPLRKPVAPLARISPNNSSLPSS